MKITKVVLTVEFDEPGRRVDDGKHHAIRSLTEQLGVVLGGVPVSKSIEYKTGRSLLTARSGERRIRAGRRRLVPTC